MQPKRHLLKMPLVGQCIIGDFLNNYIKEVPLISEKCKSSFKQTFASKMKKVVLAQVPEKERFQGFYSNLLIFNKTKKSIRTILDLKILNRFLQN